MGYLRCYRLLGTYLADKKELYSKPSAGQWLQGVAPGVCESRRNVYHMALEKLDEAYHLVSARSYAIFLNEAKLERKRLLNPLTKTQKLILEPIGLDEDALKTYVSAF
jgi:hypothetical protein